MKKSVIQVVAAIASGCAFASAPVIKPGSVTLTQDSARRVTIGYELQNEAAIVTVDIQTNGVSIGAANTRGMYGDVHVKVEPGKDKKAYWTPVKSWPDQVVSDGSMTAVVTAWATNAPPEWMIVNLDKVYDGRKDAVKYYTSLDQSPDGGDISNEVYKTSRIVLKRIPAAGVPFMMGSHSSEPGHNNGETLHKVVLSSDFYLAVYETTQAQYARMHNDPPKFYFMKDGACRPAENVTWNSIRGKTAYWPGVSRADGYGSVARVSFLGALRRHTGGEVPFDLPTEAQWEFACRAGTTTGLYTGKDITTLTETGTCPNLDEIARYKGNYNGGDTGTPGNMDISTDKATAIVGTYESNGFRLYDMLGNVREICLDWTGDYAGDAIDPTGPANDAEDAIFVSRGGSYVDVVSSCRAATRYLSQKRYQNSRVVGFRLCVPLNY